MSRIILFTITAITVITTTLIGTAIARIIINRRFKTDNKTDLTILDARWAELDKAGIDPTV